MKGQVKLSLAVALALASGSAFALGLGTIQVKSGLNQPLDAEIPVIAESPAEVSALTVDLASAEDFERVGLNRSRLTVPIEMAVSTNARGQTVIKLTTKEAVREPLIDFLIQANWAKGRVLREYTVLLDPPVTAPAAKGSTATVAPVAEKPAAAPQPLAPSKAPAKTERPQPKPPVAAAPQKPAPPPPAPAPPPKPAAHATNGNDYGPVAAGETLSEIARATRPDEKTNINQMMLALLKANPNAFYQDNINALKRGAILRIPNGDDIRSAASVRDAVTQVHSQNDSWSGKAPVSTPTLVAHTGGTDTATAKTPKSETGAAKQERLALVPPQSGKSQASADRAGAAGGTSKDMADAKAELARTKEALTSREQEATELKSRVKQLEDIGSKDQKLLSMKNSEIADLQNKLKELQAKAAAAPPATASAKPSDASKTADASTATAAASGKPEQKVTAKDIWGDLSPSDKAAPTKPAASGTAATAPAATPGASSTATPAPSATGAPATVPASTPAAATTAATAPSTGTAASMAAASSNPTATPPATTTPPSAGSAGGATVTPLPSSSASSATTAASASPSATSTPAASTSADSGSPASSTATSATAPAKTATATKISPLEPAAEPFYKNQNVLLGGGAALLLVGLLALMRFMRKPKPFMAPADPDGEFAQPDEEERRLIDTLQHEPGNTAASLELLRHYYAQGDAARFEKTAEQMHAHLMDPGAPEWDEVLAMGAVLVPNNPLFGDGGHAQDDLHAHTQDDEFAYTDAMHTQTFEQAALHTEHAVPATNDEAAFEYDLPPHVESPHEEVVSHEHTLPDLGLPSHEQERPLDHEYHMEQHVAEQVEHPAEAHAEPLAEAAPRSEELFIGEDAIGTKLDLAKAYLDMGDPEGAKSMLDEVMSEGDNMQKDEARKLLAEIR